MPWFRCTGGSELEMVPGMDSSVWSIEYSRCQCLVTWRPHFYYFAFSFSFTSSDLPTFHISGLIMWHDIEGVTIEFVENNAPVNKLLVVTVYGENKSLSFKSPDFPVVHFSGFIKWRDIEGVAVKLMEKNAVCEQTFDRDCTCWEWKTSWVIRKQVRRIMNTGTFLKS